MLKTHPAWQWVTAARVLCDKPCLLLYAYLVPSAAAAAVTLYDGLDTEGKVITILEQAAKTSLPFKPPEGILCHEGLYVGSLVNVTAVLVMYQPLVLIRAEE